MVNPTGAADPGLVYDASESDYIDFLCAQGYSPTKIAVFTGKSTTCSYPTGSSSELNYPSIAAPVPNYGVSFSAVIPRAVTNVGPVDSVYSVKISSVPGINISVEPEELVFSAARMKANFTVALSVALSRGAGGRLVGASASIVWSDGKHAVRSPVYVFPQQLRSYTSAESCRCKMVCDVSDDDECSTPSVKGTEVLVSFHLSRVQRLNSKSIFQSGRDHIVKSILLMHLSNPFMFSLSFFDTQAHV
jgi:hypothetical protein